jgi:hypothetical protein
VPVFCFSFYRRIKEGVRTGTSFAASVVRAGWFFVFMLPWSGNGKTFFCKFFKWRFLFDNRRNSGDLRRFGFHGLSSLTVKNIQNRPETLAEGVGFEPTLGFPLSLISSQVPSTTQPPFPPKLHLDHAQARAASQ